MEQKHAENRVGRKLSVSEKMEKSRVGLPNAAKND
jgi:hypothetical protein